MLYCTIKPIGSAEIHNSFIMVLLVYAGIFIYAKSECLSNECYGRLLNYVIYFKKASVV